MKNITVNPSKGWEGTIDVPITKIEDRTFYMTSAQIRAHKRFASEERERIFRHIRREKARRRRKENWRTYWRSENGRFTKTVLICLIAVAILTMTCEGIRILNQAWWYAHHDISEIIRGA